MTPWFVEISSAFYDMPPNATLSILIAAEERGAPSRGEQATGPGTDIFQLAMDEALETCLWTAG